MQYTIAGLLLALGVVLWIIDFVVDRIRGRPRGFDPTQFDTDGPIN